MKKNVRLIEALVPVVILIILLIINVKIFKDDATYGPNQLALFFSGFVACLLGVSLQKVSYKDLENVAISSIKNSLQANLILLLVGSLIGLWILSGVVPTMIYYGIQIISPKFFLPTACILCCFVSLSTGSSWSTGGTVGIALIGIGAALDIPLPMVAGAVISGSYFGDKLSPLSDTTNLAPAMAGANLFEHIRYLLITTVPAITIAIILFTIVGLKYAPTEVDLTKVQGFLETINSQFKITPFLFIAPFFVLFLVYKKIPALPSMFLGAILGGILAMIFQPHLLDTNSYKTIIEVAADGFKSDSGIKEVDKLFSRGGMSSMLNTVWLIITAMFFGGMMEACGYLQKIAGVLLDFVSGTGSLILATVTSCIFLNVTASDQYLAIVVAGRMFRNAFKQRGLAAVNLSRSLEDGGTVTSVLVPWNSGGAYFSGILGVPTLAYLPYCFFNILSPIISVIVGFLGLYIRKGNEAA